LLFNFPKKSSSAAETPVSHLAEDVLDKS